MSAKIYGPHLEDVAREWTLTHADASTLGGLVNCVQPAAIACREHKTGHELDVVAPADLLHEPTWDARFSVTLGDWLVAGRR